MPLRGLLSSQGRACASERRQSGSQKFPDLRFDVFAIARKIRTAWLELSARLARGWHIQNEYWDVVHAFPKSPPI